MGDDIVVEVTEVPSDIIEDVSRLPEVVDPTKIYRIQTETVTEGIAVEDGYTMSITDFNIVLVDELPEADDTGTVFVLKDSGVGYLYYEDGWYTAGQLYELMYNYHLVDQGFVTDEELEKGGLANGLYMHKRLFQTLGIPTIGSTKIYEYENGWVRGEVDWVRGFLDDGLDELTIPYGLTGICDYACYARANRLMELTIPDTVQRIGKYAFVGLGASHLEIPASVISIDEGAFSASKIETLVIHGTPSVFIGAFRSSWIESVTLPDTLTDIRASAFDYTPIYYNNSNWENDVFYIGSHLMRGNSSCSGHLVVKDGTKVVAGSAFSESHLLESVVFPEGVTHIGDYVFDYAGNSKGNKGALTAIEFPSTVTHIGGGIVNCLKSSTVTITVKGNTPPNISPTTFYNGTHSPAVKIYVPAGSIEAYKDAYAWSEYADVIFPMEE